MAEDLKTRLEHEFERARKRSASLAEEVDSRLARAPKKLRGITNLEAVKKRRPEVEWRINEWNDGEGNIVYLHDGVGMNPLKPDPVFTRIRTQRDTFSGLEADQQSRIRGEFESNPNAVNTQPFQDLLQSEALERKFQELKQK